MPSHNGRKPPGRGGVSFHRERGKWEARPNHQGRKHYLGLYNTEQEAQDAVDGWRARIEAGEADNFHEYISSSDAAKQKRQEYNRTMGETAAMLANPAQFSDLEINRLARFVSALGEDERRWVNRRIARKEVIALSREMMMLSRIDEIATRVFAGKVEPRGYAKKPGTGKKARILRAHLSDLHIGAALDSRELPQPFGRREEARRLAKITAEICDYKPQHRETTELNLLLNGDLIDGMLMHFYRDGDPLTEQWVVCLELLCQVVAHCAASFPAVKIDVQPGNHGRNKLIHPGRATSSKWDSFEFMLGYSLRKACERLSNVEIRLTRRPYSILESFGEHGFMSHGDTDSLNVGSVGKSISVEKIETQISRINASGVYGHKFSFFVAGHLHTPLMLELPSGTFILNGCLRPPTGHDLANGYFPSCGQWIWESVEGYPVGDARLLRVGPSEDQDDSLEKIIKPVDLDVLIGAAA